MSEPKQMIWGEAVFTSQESRYGPSAPKWSCDECGSVGYGDAFGPHEWGRAHSRGHEPCPWCGRLLTVIMSGEQRVHAQCPNRPEEVETAWLDAKGDLILTRREVAEGVRS